MKYRRVKLILAGLLIAGTVSYGRKVTAQEIDSQSAQKHTGMIVSGLRLASISQNNQIALKFAGQGGWPDGLNTRDIKIVFLPSETAAAAGVIREIKYSGVSGQVLLI